MMKVKVFGIRVDKRAIIRWKIYIDRAKMYIGYINLVMMVVVFLNAIKDNKYGKILEDNYIISIPVLIVLFIGFSFILGYLDTKLGLRREELRNLSIENPVQKEILETLREIKKRTISKEKE